MRRLNKLELIALIICYGIIGLVSSVFGLAHLILGEISRVPVFMCNMLMTTLSVAVIAKLLGDTDRDNLV